MGALSLCTYFVSRSHGAPQHPSFLIERLEPDSSRRLIIGRQTPPPRQPAFVLKDLLVKNRQKFQILRIASLKM
jgi:hypothetical protein